MSLFGSLMRDFDDDPLFGMHSRAMRQMNHMMNSFFADPFPDLMGGFGVPPRLMGPTSNEGALDLPYNMNSMNTMFGDLGQLTNNPNVHSFSSSTVMSMTTGPDGRPQVYQASSSTRQAPGGVRETRKSLHDTRVGVRKMAIGRHINERGHVVEREHNLHSGDQEERQDFINLEEEEADQFNDEWRQRTHQAYGAIEHPSVTRDQHRRPRAELLSLPSSSTPQNHTHGDRSRKRDHDPDDQSGRNLKHSRPQYETSM